MTKLNKEEFKKLQEQWYDKIKKEGFEDIERPFDQLKKLPQGRSTEEYYRRAGQYYHHNDWSEYDSVEKDVWEMHQDGATTREINKKLGLYTDKTTAIIRKHKELMKNWLEKELEEEEKDE